MKEKALVLAIAIVSVGCCPTPAPTPTPRADIKWVTPLDAPLPANAEPDEMELYLERRQMERTVEDAIRRNSRER